LTTEIEERIHKALAPHPLERLEDGYRRVHPEGSGMSTLRILPVNESREGMNVVAIAEIVAEYAAASVPPFHATGVQRLNAWSVYGAYHLNDGRLRQKAQYSIYGNDPAVHLAVQIILNAFGGQLPLGRSSALAMTSAAAQAAARAPRDAKPMVKAIG